MDEYVALLEKLIRLQPVTENVSAVNKVTETLKDFLSSRGLFCTVEELSNRKILYASTKKTKTPSLLLNAHVDVVPAITEDQFEPVIKDGWIIGRGTGDCLGNAVCIVKTLCLLAGKNLSVGAVFSSDEETGGATTEHMVKLSYAPSRLLTIVDNYDDDNISYAQKGILSLKLISNGRGGHSSEPWHADNPIDKLISSYSRLKDEWEKRFPASDNDKWFNTMAPTIINAGFAQNQIPDTAELTLNFRFTEVGDDEKIRRFVVETTGLDAETIHVSPPVSLSNDSPELKMLGEIMEDTLGKKTQFRRMNGATDARWFAACGKPIAVIGIKETGIHAGGEKAEIASIETYARILVRLAEKLG